jgi:hypothetical protein
MLHNPELSIREIMSHVPLFLRFTQKSLWCIWHLSYGVVYDELKVIERGKYAPQAPRADPAGRPRHTLWPASGGVSLSLSGLQ